MKVLRVFFTEHHLHKEKYINRKQYRDFDEQTIPEVAYREILKSGGSIADSWHEITVLTNQRIKITPSHYVTIHSHAIVNPVKQENVFTAERVSERDLFPADEIRKFTGKKK